MPDARFKCYFPPRELSLTSSSIAKCNEVAGRAGTRLPLR